VPVKELQIRHCRQILQEVQVLHLLLLQQLLLVQPQPLVLQHLLMFLFLRDFQTLALVLWPLLLLHPQNKLVLLLPALQLQMQ